MDTSDGSLHAQHAQIDRSLAAAVAAGRAARWQEYRRRLAALREGLAQHMAFEEEALFPALEQATAGPVRELRNDHEEIRRHLDILGAAVPEQDPAGCLAALEDLAALLSSHHHAEMTLDPQYASRPTPPLRMNDPPAMDLRGLQPPEPIVRILQALEQGGGAPLRVILPHEPLPLYGLLRERGYSHAGSPRPDGGFEILIERA
jgi:hemerythrin HHE cation binding domain-containing protein/uncharacterized protein DUF2249